MRDYESRGRGHDTGFVRSSSHTDTYRPPERTPAEKADDAVVGFERDVEAVDTALNAVAKAKEANDPSAWQQAHERVGKSIEAAERELERVRSHAASATPEAKARLAAAEKALDDHKKTASTVADAPRGWNEVSREQQILEILAAPVEGSKEVGFARKEQLLKAELAQLSAVESRALVMRLKKRDKSDPIAAAIGRFTSERQQRIIVFLEGARKREAMQAAHQRSSEVASHSSSPSQLSDAVHDPALAPNGPLSFDNQPNSIAVETSCRQDPTTKDIGELVKGVPVATTGDKTPAEQSKQPPSAKLAAYLNTRSSDVWRAVREYLYSAVWPHASSRLEWNELLFNTLVVDAIARRAGDLTETKLRELLYPHDVFAAIAPHVAGEGEKDLSGAATLVLGQLFRAALGPSVARMTARYVDVADAMYAVDPKSAPTVRRAQLITSHPLDSCVADSLTAGIARVAPDADVLNGKRKVQMPGLRKVKLTFMGAVDPALWFVVRAEPADATPEEVATALFDYAKHGGEPTSYYAYGLASTGALHALPASWAIMFPEAQQYAPEAIKKGKLPDPTNDTIASRLGVIASTSSSDGIALTQSGPDPRAAQMSSVQVAEVFEQCSIQLEHLRRTLVPWELADHIVAETSYVLTKRNSIATMPSDQVAAWGSIALGQRDRLYRIATALRSVGDAATQMRLVDKRSAGAKTLREIVARYAEAAATSHLANTSEQILAEAQQMQAGLSLRALQSDIVELESAMEQGHAVEGSDKQMREQAHQYLETKEQAKVLEAKLLNGGEVSTEELERVQLQAQELALQARLHTMQVQLDHLVDAWRAAGQGLIPTVVSTRKFNDIGPASVFIHAALGDIYNDLNAEAKHVKPINDKTGGTFESAKLDARRAAVARGQERFAQLQQDRDLAHFFNDAYDAVKSQQLRTAITHAALAIGIGIASAGVAGWVSGGLMAAEGVGAVAELSMGARVAITATEVMGNAVGQTVTSAGEQHATSFWGALADNAAFVLAPKLLEPAGENIQAAKAFEQMLTKQLATIESQEARAALAMSTLAKTGRVIAWPLHHAGAITAHTIMGMAMGAVVSKGHELINGKSTAHAAGGGDVSQDLIIQGASVAIGKLVHASIGERLPGLKQLANRRDLAHAQQVHAEALELHRLSAEIAANPDGKAALELLHKRSAVLEGELRLIDELAAREAAHPSQGAPSAAEIEAMRTDVKAQLGEVHNQAMLGMQWHLLGLHELAPGVWSGTHDQLAAAVEEAKASGHHVEPEGDPTEVSMRLRIDGKEVELHATRDTATPHGSVTAKPHHSEHEHAGHGEDHEAAETKPPARNTKARTTDSRAPAAKAAPSTHETAGEAIEPTDAERAGIQRLRDLLLRLDNAKRPLDGATPDRQAIKSISDEITAVLDALKVTGVDKWRLEGLVLKKLGIREQQILADQFRDPAPARKHAIADTNKDGISDGARVGVPAMEIPDKIPRLKILSPEAAAAQERFASAYETPGGREALAEDYLEMMGADRDKDGRERSAEERKTFATDDAKRLSPDYEPDHGTLAEKNAAKATMNLAVHQTANAVAKLAFLMRLDAIASTEPGATVMVTAGGVAAGKSHAIRNNADAKALVDRAAVIWDSAGEQNSTELPWVIAEAKKRGLVVEILYVHQVPEKSWPRVVSRAAKEGRMVDARLHAESYAEGARNFDAVQRKFPDVKTVVIDVSESSPDAGVRKIDRVPTSALDLDADTVHQRNTEELRGQQNLPDHIKQGGMEQGEGVWGPPNHRAIIAELGEIPVSFMPPGMVVEGTTQPLDRSTYYVNRADGKRMLELTARLGPSVETHAYRKGFLLRRTAAPAGEWYFEFRDVEAPGTAPVASREGGLPPPNAATVELWGFSGVKKIKGRPRKEWTLDEQAEFQRVKDFSPLMWAGHIGISLDGGKTIIGFTPDIPRGMTTAEGIAALIRHEAFPGVLGDDSAIFLEAAALARDRGWDTEVTVAVSLVDTPEKMKTVHEVARLSGMKPGEHGYGYSFPLEPHQIPPSGEAFGASNGFPASCVRNCGTFPTKVGVKIPEPTGQVKAFIPELRKWAEQDGPIDFRSAAPYGEEKKQ